MNSSQGYALRPKSFIITRSAGSPQVVQCSHIKRGSQEPCPSPPSCFATFVSPFASPLVGFFVFVAHAFYISHPRDVLIPPHAFLHLGRAGAGHHEQRSRSSCSGCCVPCIACYYSNHTFRSLHGQAFQHGRPSPRIPASGGSTYSIL